MPSIIPPCSYNSAVLSALLDPYILSVPSYRIIVGANSMATELQMLNMFNVFCEVMDVDGC